MDIFEFTKKFTTFKPSPYHEAFYKTLEEDIERGRNISYINSSNYPRWYKDLRLTEFLYSHLTKMIEGQTFALASVEGIQVFKMIEFQSYQKAENNINLNTTEGETNG